MTGCVCSIIVLLNGIRDSGKVISENWFKKASGALPPAYELLGRATACRDSEFGLRIFIEKKGEVG